MNYSQANVFDCFACFMEGTALFTPGTSYASYALKRRDVGEEEGLIGDQGERNREKGEGVS